MLKTILKNYLQTPLIAKAFSSIIIKNGIVLNHDYKSKSDVLIEGETIKKIVPQGTQLPAGPTTKIIDAKGKFVIPGGIDSHTHLQMPFMGTVAIDDYNIGTQAALSGGTTTFIDFIIPNKGQDLLEAYHQWQDWAAPKVNCDYTFHCAVTWFDEKKSPEMMKKITEKGVVSFKPFLAYKGSLMVTDTEFYNIAKNCKKLGSMLLTHCENGEMVEEGQKEVLSKGIYGPEGHYLSRPEYIEAEAVHRALTIAHFVNTPILIVHVMSRDACEMIARARTYGWHAFGETIASALGVDGTHYWNKDWQHAAGYVMSPPLNPDPRTKEYLMKQLSNGTLSFVGTDNCTFSQEQKRMGLKDFTKIPNGVNGIEDRLSVVWNNGVKAGLLSPYDFVRVTSTMAAQMYGLYPKKGRIAEGCDADVVIWDGDKERVISKDTHHHKVDFNVYEGLKVKGVAETTISRGKIVWDQGKFYTVQGHGKFVPREPFGMIFDRTKEADIARDLKKFECKRD